MAKFRQSSSAWATRLLNPGHSAFKLSKVSRGTCKMGYMVPIYVTDVLPTDKFNISVDEMVRFMPMIAPPMHNVKVYFDYFFVPNRLIWSNWETFRTGGKDGTDTSVPPYITSPDETGFSVGSLADYFGMPTGVAGKRVSALPFRAHNLIYNYYVRDENIGAERTVPLTDGSDTTSPTTLFKRCWPRDYFVGALSDRQRGDPTYLPLGTQAPVSVFGNGKTLGLMYMDGDNLRNVSLGTGSSTYTGFAQVQSYNETIGAAATSPLSISQKVGVSSNPNYSGLKGTADLRGATAASVDDVRVAFQTQLIKQLLMRAGYRYREFLMAFFGTDAGDGRLQWPSYLGGMSSDVLFSEVLQTSSSDSVTPQGNMAGHGISATSTKRISFRCPEDGWIIGYMSVVPKACYNQGLPRMFTRETRYDYYNPLFSHLGEKLILNEEIYCDGTSADKEGFAYVPQYEEYRRAFDTSHGLLRSSAAYWAFDRVFASRPSFNQNFLECTPSTAPFVVTDGDQIIYAVRTNVLASRPVDRLGEPGFVDHYF